jgi:hypothetical protein
MNYGSPILITANTLKYKHNELVDILNEQLRKWKKSTTPPCP